jgi:hypothetical protein
MYCQHQYLSYAECKSYTESMNIHPTSGGVAPLYSPVTPSFLTVCSRQSNGPRNCETSVVCNRTLTVSNGWPTAIFSSDNRTESAFAYPTTSQCQRILQQRTLYNVSATCEALRDPPPHSSPASLPSS